MNPIAGTLEKRQFYGHWRWVHIRYCGNDHVNRILGNDTRRRPGLPPGAIKCYCGSLVKF